MTITLRSKLKNLPKSRLKKINKKAKELIAQETTLRDLRKALDLTQSDIALKLHMKQEAISRPEPNRPVVELKGFEDIYKY